MNQKNTQFPQNEAMKDLYKLSPNDVYGALNTETGGLSNGEAVSRLEQYGKNILQEKKGTPSLLNSFLILHT